MTFNDLEQIFVDGCYRSILTNHEDLPEKAHRRAGLKAVVEALRDEIVEDGDCLYCVGTTKMYNEILAKTEQRDVDRDGAEAAGAPTRKDGEASQPGTPTPAAAPVCEWTLTQKRYFNHDPVLRYQTGCGAEFGYDYKQCQGCGKPIKFMEAAR
jgi:hypothetical protein